MPPVQTPVLQALQQAITTEWEGESAELLPLLRARIAPSDERGQERPGWRPPKGWPTSPRSLTATLTRRSPTLRTLGWQIEKGQRAASRTKVITWTLKPPADPDEARESENRAAVAAFAAEGSSSQVSGHIAGAANGAATVRQTDSAAADAANDDGLPQVAARVAAPIQPPLTSANEDHAATAATAAPITDTLASPLSQRRSTEPAMHRPRGCPRCTATSTDIVDGRCHRCRRTAA